MSDSASGGGAVLNWRGPVLAAAIFGGVFAALLLMAHQNRSNTSDEGSSFRQDPYGTSLLFDSYQRAGYEVERSEDKTSLSDQDPSRTTAFFIGGEFGNASPSDTANEDARRRSDYVRNFLERGGRVVLVQMVSSSPSKSGTEQWMGDANLQWSKNPSGPGWAAPNHRAMPGGSEMIYLASDAPWLSVGARFRALYEGPLQPVDGPKAESNEEPEIEPHSHVYMAMQTVGKGELIVASQESFLLNEVIKTHPNPVLLDFMVGGRPVVWVDETLHGSRQDEGVLWLVQRYRLQTALLLFWGALLVLLWSMSGDLVRRPRRDWSAEIVRHGQGAGVAAQRLLRRGVTKDKVVSECWEQFRRRSPEDAQAICDDPEWGARLRAALANPPLTGYKELTKLIAERRAAAKGLRRSDREAANESSVSQKRILQEARIV